MKTPQAAVARCVSGGTNEQLECPPSLRSRAGLHGILVLVACVVVVAAHAAKNPDKPEKPDKRIEKLERKLDRAGLLEAEPAAPPSRPEPRPAMAATAQDRSSRSERSSKSERSERTEPRAERAESSEGRSASATPADANYEKFRLITERNIFNPNRVGRTREVPVEKPPHVDEISLVGTMQYERGLIAFFDSPDSDYKKNLREGESIAGFKVQKINADGVELTRDDKPIPLKVAQQLRRKEGGDWIVTGAPPPRADPRATSAGEELRASAAAAAQEVPADASDVLKRLMESRAKQLKR